VAWRSPCIDSRSSNLLARIGFEQTSLTWQWFARRHHDRPAVALVATVRKTIWETVAISMSD
jgi:hypothetical protein